MPRIILGRPLNLADEAADQRGAFAPRPRRRPRRHLRAREADADIFELSTMNCTARFRVLHLQKICRRIFPLG
jgi:hypothetical protein